MPVTGYLLWQKQRLFSQNIITFSKKINTSPRAKRFRFAFNQVSAQSDIILEQMWFEGYHCGSHLGFQNRKILAILNLHLALMFPIKFQLNLTHGLGGDVV